MTETENQFSNSGETKIKKNRSTKIVIVVALIVVAVISIIVLDILPDDTKLYEQKMKEFVEIESKALALYKMPKNSSRENFLYEIKENGLKHWNENVRLVNEMDQLDIPDELHEKNKKLLHYLDLRIRSYRLIYKTMDEGTKQYNDSLRYYNAEIKKMLDELGSK